jgi:hypothetical protein
VKVQTIRVHYFDFKIVNIKLGGILMSNRSTTQFDKMKYEIASQVGVNLKQGYNGDLASKDAGRIGGNIVKKVFETYTGKNYNDNK